MQAAASTSPPHAPQMYRHGGAPRVTTLAYYYILDGSIYQAPSLQAALQARLVSALAARSGGTPAGRGEAAT